MTIAGWEYFSLASMLISTHGDEAEYVAADNLEKAEAIDDESNMLVWAAVMSQLPRVRAKLAQRKR